MFDKKPDSNRRLMPLAVSLCALICAAPAFGQTASDQDTAPAKKSDSKRASVSQAKATSPNATINLVNLLVKQGVLTEDQAAALIKQADDEAYVSRQAAKDATAKADEAAKAASTASAAASPPGTKHVTYVPEIVKRQLRDEIKQEVMATAQKESWASPGAYPEWAHRIHFYGDVRARYQSDMFPSGNDQLDAFNFNAVNTGSPFDRNSATNGYSFPTYNATQNRQLAELRARFGLEADLLNGFTAGIRIATGNDSSPVSTNQTLGSSASGGDFSKYSMWLDRGYIKYQAWGDDLAFSIGRFDNPFWSPTDLVWYRELGFDGLAVQTKREVYEGFTAFASAGAFPIYNTALNLGVNLDINPATDLQDPTTGGQVKIASHDEWLFGGQVGFEERFKPESSFRFAVAYYDFDNVQGQLSSPCLVVLTASDICSTDQDRPMFAQKGNTYMELRNIPVNPSLTPGTQPDFQYFGLAAQYRPIVVSGQLDLGDYHPVHVVLDGEFVWNSAFDKAAVAAVALNNFGGSFSSTGTGPYVGGNEGWIGRLTVGDKEIRHLWDWNVHAGYKYLESDATIDAFVDPDFGLGGTNLKGYFVGGNLGLSENVWATVRWMSANNISSIPYAVDVLQVDLNAKF
jgi:putative porin